MLKMILILCLSFIIAVAANSTSTTTNTTSTTSTSSSTCYSVESCLYDKLMNTYNNQVRPAAGPGNPVDVSLTLNLDSIINLDEKNEQLHSVLKIRATWNDRFLTWEPAQFPIGVMLIDVKKLWLPDLTIINSVDAFVKRTYQEDFRAYVTQYGLVSWYFGGIFKTSCSLNLNSYPFDKQTCVITIQNWAYLDSLVNITEVSLTETDPSNGLWSVEKMSTEIKAVRIEHVTYPSVDLTIELKRKVGYYNFNIVLPCVFITLVSMCLFWLPPDCGERISLGITVLLAYSIFQIVVMDNTPTSSDQTPFISKLLLMCMGTSAMSVTTSIFVLYLHFKRTSKRVPKWLRTIAFRGLAKIFCMTDDIPQMDEKDNDVLFSSSKVGICEKDESQGKMKYPDNKSLAEEELVSILRELRYLTNCVKENKQGEFISDEWKFLAMVTDRILFIFVFVMIFCMTIGFIVDI